MMTTRKKRKRRTRTMRKVDLRFWIGNLVYTIMKVVTINKCGVYVIYSHVC